MPFTSIPIACIIHNGGIYVDMINKIFYLQIKERGFSLSLKNLNQSSRKLHCISVTIWLYPERTLLCWVMADKQPSQWKSYFWGKNLCQIKFSFIICVSEREKSIFFSLLWVGENIQKRTFKRTLRHRRTWVKILQKHFCWFGWSWLHRILDTFGLKMSS